MLKQIENISLSVQTTPKLMGDEKLSNSLLCYSSGEMWEKVGWVISESEKAREPCGHVFFLQHLPTSPIPCASHQRVSISREAGDLE